MNNRRCATETLLDHSRHFGDPPVDAAVIAYVDRFGQRALAQVATSLFREQHLAGDHPLVAALNEVDTGRPADPAQIARGQRLFELYGPEILLVLGSCSLPLAYSAGNGVQTIYRARRMKDDPIRRLCDTAQMVVNVMQPGELAAGGVGWRATRKVRLIHALIRHDLLNRTDDPWRAEWGIPINQEDLAGTLLTFSVAVIQSLRRLGAKVATDDADGYVFAWAAVGRLLGITDPALLPDTEKDALALASQIGARQVQSTREGRELMRTLLGAVESLFPIAGYATSLTRYLLADTPFGTRVIDALNLPEPNWTRWLVAARAAEKRAIFALLEVVPGAHRRRRALARHVVRHLLLARRDAHAPFEIPPSWIRAWGVSVDEREKAARVTG